MTFQNGDKVMAISNSWDRPRLDVGEFKQFGPLRAYIISRRSFLKVADSAPSYHESKDGPYPIDWIRPYDGTIAQKVAAELKDIELKREALDMRARAIRDQFLGKVGVKP